MKQAIFCCALLVWAESCGSADITNVTERMNRPEQGTQVRAINAAAATVKTVDMPNAAQAFSDLYGRVTVSDLDRALNMVIASGGRNLNDGMAGENTQICIAGKGPYEYAIIQRGGGGYLLFRLDGKLRSALWSIYNKVTKIPIAPAVAIGGGTISSITVETEGQDIKSIYPVFSARIVGGRFDGQTVDRQSSYAPDCG